MKVLSRGNQGLCKLFYSRIFLSGNRRADLMAFLVLTILGQGVCIQNASAASVAPKGSFHEDHRGTPRLEFPDASASKTGSAGDYLTQNADRYKLPANLSNLKVVTTRESLAGVHTRYQQVLNGIQVEGAEIVVSQKKTDGSVYQVYNNTYPVASPVPVAKTTISKNTALEAAWNHLRVHGSLKASPEAELVYIPEGTGFRLVYKTFVAVDAPNGYWEHKIDAVSGEVISVKRKELSRKYGPEDIPDFSAYKGSIKNFDTELNLFKSKQKAQPKAESKVDKTTVSGSALVFDPDPRTTLMNDALQDSSSAATFDPAYFNRTMQGLTLDGGVYYLDGPWVSITNLPAEPPLTPVSTTTNGIWTAKRGKNAFNDAMCYFHIDQNQRYIQSLGFTNNSSILAEPILVDSDGANGDDNSWYTYSRGVKYIAFGHGGVDDAEDADVILHEYGHALTHDIVSSWGGGDTGAIGEGFGDYWGGSYSWITTNGSTHHPERAFSWDGHGSDRFPGRLMNMTSLTYDHSHTYTAHETLSGIPNYSDQLWSAPIFMAFTDLIAMGRPREEMDTIILESFFGLGSGVKMRDMANATVSAAQTLYPGGPHAGVYSTRFVNQLIFDPPALPTPILVYPVGGEVLNGGSPANIQWSLNGASATAKTTIEYTSLLSGGTTVFFDDIESGVNGWTATKSGGTDWAIVTSNSYSPTHSWLAVDEAGVADQYLTSVLIPVSSGAVLSFWHYYQLESTYDGAVVEISIDGSTWNDIGNAATQNGYNSTISGRHSSPIMNRSAFSGNSGGFIETKIPLSSYAGMNVQIRFREADDSSVSSTGWWVDDIGIVVADTWQSITMTAANATSYSWTLPGAEGTNYAIRLKLTANGYSDSAWATSGTFTFSGTDFDGDGLPNWWEQLYFGNMTNALPISISSNGVNTLLEAYVAGIDPTDPNSRFILTSFGPELTWNAASGRVYSVYWTPNLTTPFQSMDTNIHWSSGGFTDTVHNAWSEGFYKLEVDLE